MCPLPSSPDYDDGMTKTNKGIRPKLIWSIEKIIEDSKLKKIEPVN